ncbi:conserved exported hypothetical protein [Bradyrhizobium sp. ORS 375]|uniref:hypothetical protein n=1 Tax=Bradyrhizobium sp. (strain ORS 375) TaxID=566679 RepID=UPI000240697F|nr:hypothetical protein [Bradyrhizobium sp. ORS 375]CCD94524.1 conserved exported hypothetical protein [Bradyrhizobium sp. ORS 375]
MTGRQIRQWMVGGALMLSALSAVTASARAGEMLPGSAFAIACENGGSYVLRSRPVLAPGEIVTAQLYLAPHHPVPVRLIPMGDGYRYAGRGVWLDGIRDQALLYLRKYQPVACTVSRI